MVCDLAGHCWGAVGEGASSPCLVDEGGDANRVLGH